MFNLFGNFMNINNKIFKSFTVQESRNAKQRSLSRPWHILRSQGRKIATKVRKKGTPWQRRLAVRQSAAMSRGKRAVHHWWFGSDALVRLSFFTMQAASLAASLASYLRDALQSKRTEIRIGNSITVQNMPLGSYRRNELRNEFITRINSAIRRSVCYCHTRVCTKSSGQRCNPLTIFEKRSSSVPIFVFVNRELRPSSDYDSIPVAIPTALTVTPRTDTKNSLLLHIVSWDKNSISLFSFY